VFIIMRGDLLDPHDDSLRNEVGTSDGSDGSRAASRVFTRVSEFKRRYYYTGLSGSECPQFDLTSGADNGIHSRRLSTWEKTFRRAAVSNGCEKYVCSESGEWPLLTWPAGDVEGESGQGQTEDSWYQGPRGWGVSGQGQTADSLHQRAGGWHLGSDIWVSGPSSSRPWSGDSGGQWRRAGQSGAVSVAGPEGNAGRVLLQAIAGEQVQVQEAEDQVQDQVQVQGDRRGGDGEIATAPGGQDEGQVQVHTVPVSGEESKEDARFQVSVRESEERRPEDPSEGDGENATAPGSQHAGSAWLLFIERVCSAMY
jgi:hypothetical protein